MKKFLRKIKKNIRNQLGITKILENQNQINYKINSFSNQINEILKASIFNNTIADSKWLKIKSFSPGRWAVDYAFLYTLYRVLNDTHPKSILEFGLGQSSKLIHQYADYFKDVKALTCEHDEVWINFFMCGKEGEYPLKIQKIDLEEIEYKGEKTLSIANLNSLVKNEKYDLIVIDAPFGSPKYSRPQILNLIENIENSFCILMDDYDRNGEKETIQELFSILYSSNIKFCSTIYSGSKEHILICSENWKFLTTM